MDFYNSLDGCDGHDYCDDYDEFLFQSIQRYNTLQMFNLQNVPYHLLQLDSESLCVGSKRAKGSSELLKLKLPIKLTLSSSEEEGRSRENDFKVLSGIYIDNLLYKVGKLGPGNSILTSEINTTGLHIYSLTDGSLGNKNKIWKLDAMSWTNPDFVVMPGGLRIICSKCCHEPLIQIDSSSGKKLKDIKHPLCTLNIFSRNVSDKINPHNSNNIKCNALSANLIAVLNTYTGNVVLHDLRTNDTFTSLPMVSQASIETWTLSECNFLEIRLDYFGILSNTTSFCVYDIRKNGIMLHSAGKNPPVESYMNMKLKFSGKERKFSISGMNSFVEIFGINENNFEPIFTHHGHCPSNVPSIFVTDHIWLQTGNREYIVSICVNKTLNCWN